MAIGMCMVATWICVRRQERTGQWEHITRRMLDLRDLWHGLRLRDLWHGQHLRGLRLRGL